MSSRGALFQRSPSRSKATRPFVDYQVIQYVKQMLDTLAPEVFFELSVDCLDLRRHVANQGHTGVRDRQFYPAAVDGISLA